MAQMGDDDGATDDEGDIHAIHDLVLRVAVLDALLKVVVDAVVAAQHHRRGQAQQFLGFPRQGAVFVSRGVEAHEPFEGEMVGGHDAVVAGGSSVLS